MTDQLETANIVPIHIEDEIQKSYLGYAMSVIVGRALPSVQDGLKPVHRRVLYSMHRLGLTHGSKYKKCAAITGDVMGRYHPHGDKAIYDAIVRMAQDFSMRYPLVDGQGNFGSIDGDAPAAMRYTEARMTKLSEFMLADIARDTVEFIPNYDGSQDEPTVLPTRIPQLLVNGSSGIAVGMATNIPPHNLGEVCNALLTILDQPDLIDRELFEIIRGPDFPTAGIIMGRRGIFDAYTTGKGRVVIRARCLIEEKGAKQRILIHELPYRVNKSLLLQRIGQLVREKKLVGITSLSDDSDRKGLQISIEVARSQNPELLLNQLYKLTDLQTVFGIQFIALENGEPKLMSLRRMLDSFLEFRREVVTRRSVYDLNKYRQRLSVLEGLSVAIAHIDQVVELIKKSEDPKSAKQNLLRQKWAIEGIRKLLKIEDDADLRPDDIPPHCGFQDGYYQMTETQAQAILDMKLVRLTGLEHGIILNEYQSLVKRIRELLTILQDPSVLRNVIRDEIKEVLAAFGDDRRSEISADESYLLEHEDLIEDEPCLVTLSDQTYIGIRDPEEFRIQRRGGRGARAANTREEEQIAIMVPAMLKDTLLFFTNRGVVYAKRTFELPRGSRSHRGRPLNNLIQIQAEEKITAIMAVRDFNTDQSIVMITRNGVIKRTKLPEFSSIRRNGKIAVRLNENDSVVGAELADEKQSILLATSGGMAIRFPVTNVRAMGRVATGVRGVRLRPGQFVVSMLILATDTRLVWISEGAYGTATDSSAFNFQARGGIGVRGMRLTESDRVLTALMVPGDNDQYHLALINNQGTLIKVPLVSIPETKARCTKGVRLMRLAKDQRLTGATLLVRDKDEDGEIDDADETENSPPESNRDARGDSTPNATLPTRDKDEDIDDADETENSPPESNRDARGDSTPNATLPARDKDEDIDDADETENSPPESNRDARDDSTPKEEATRDKSET